MDYLERKTESKGDHYRAIVRKMLAEYGAYKPAHGDIEVQTIFDKERDHYQVVAVGWDKQERIYGCSIHLDIKDEKVWIQANNTELDIGQYLVEMGVPKSDIVIGFQPPFIRKYSGYAV